MYYSRFYRRKYGRKYAPYSKSYKNRYSFRRKYSYRRKYDWIRKLTKIPKTYESFAGYGDVVGYNHYVKSPTFTARKIPIFNSILSSQQNKQNNQQSDYFIKGANFDKSQIPDFYFPKTSEDKKLIGAWWKYIFYNTIIVKSLAGDCTTYTSTDYGLIYFYNINGPTRYVGQTRENSLKWRMTKRQANGMIGYYWEMKVRMLNAYKYNQLAIYTIKMPVDELDKAEEHYIKLLAPSNRLWNRDLNDYFDYKNYSI